MYDGEQLFRHESGRIVAALTRIFGLENLALAEDVVQDTFCRALEVWKIRGVPDNPSAWLMKAAKNRAIDLLRRERTARRFAPELARLFESEWTLVPTVNGIFTDETLKDDQLRMMFTCCDPHISEEAQVAVTLNLLAGFTASEIASSFLTTRAAIEKRIERAKKVLSASKSLFDLTDRDLPERLSAVHRTLYLLFNEGYHGASKSGSVRVELCREAMRLASLLLDKPLVASPATYALCALMWLHAGRLPARVDGHGELVALGDQDRTLWDARLIAKGNEFLELSASGSELSEYHVEAAIASIHCTAARAEDTNWERIVWLYDTLMAIRPSPVIALNRAIALAQQSGPERGIQEIHAIEQRERLQSYPFFAAALGELELRAGRVDRARKHFEEAAALARNPMERRFLENRIQAASR
ncbi:MAG TPA: sigma-70 family RNA polymerase sigma factor [Candidatus Baltobacteraceae bacterium]|jgi:RNA polymerase sigma-70 factor (ECF subfamily)|nr:sigma-70 family RNA polymerase sigma factor [Candidatus Baltobacteraceae bacterium]